MAMFRYEVQFLGRNERDFARHKAVAEGIRSSGKLAFKSYYFAGIKGLIVLVENEQDRDALLKSVPRSEIVGSWPLNAAVKQAA